MTARRKRYSVDFKAKVSLEAIREKLRWLLHDFPGRPCTMPT